MEEGNPEEGKLVNPDVDDSSIELLPPPLREKVSTISTTLSEKSQAFSNISEEERVKMILFVTQSMGLMYSEERYHSGPLPSAKSLGEYENIQPGLADRIVKMAEKQLDHRQNLESIVIPEEVRQSKRGQMFGFIISAAGIVSSGILILLDHDIAGSIFGVGSLTSLVSLFVIGKRRQAREEKPSEEE